MLLLDCLVHQPYFLPLVYLFKDVVVRGLKAHLDSDTACFLNFWQKFLVPIGPLGTGALLTLIPQLPIPEMFAEGMLNRMVFGVALGLISTLVYRLVKKNILDKLGKKDEETPYVEE